MEENKPNMEMYVLMKFQNYLHCPKMFGKGRYPDCTFVAMQLLGKNLNEVRKQCPLNPARLSISTALRVVVQCLEGIESLHYIGYLHRDIKPANFCVGKDVENQSTVYLIDFGLARYFLTKDGSVRAERKKVGFRGTLKYASLNAHDCKDLARRDDIWLLFYAIYDLMVGDLPWKSAGTDKDVVGRMKRETKPETVRWVTR